MQVPKWKGLAWWGSHAKLAKQKNVLQKFWVGAKETRNMWIQKECAHYKRKANWRTREKTGSHGLVSASTFMQGTRNKNQSQAKGACKTWAAYRMKEKETKHRKKRDTKEICITAEAYISLHAKHINIQSHWKKKKKFSKSLEQKQCANQIAEAALYTKKAKQKTIMKAGTAITSVEGI